MGKKYRCCSYCDSTEYKNFHGYQIGDEEETPHRKGGKGKKECKRSKDGKHDFSLKKEGYIYGNVRQDDGTRKWEPRLRTYIVCAKCSKPQNYMWKYGWA